MPTTLVPGLLVSLKTSITGNVRYFKKDIEDAKLIDDGTTQAVWETTRVVTDAANHEAAVKARTKARTTITKLCIASTFGLLCPEDRVAELEAAIAEARKVADEFNESSTCSTLKVFVLTGRVASNDQEAIRAINSEVQDLIEQMANGIERKDVGSIREAAFKAKALGNMLSIEAASKVQLAIDASRGWANEANKASKDGTEVKADTVTVTRVRGASALFMDDEPAPVATPKKKKQSTLDLGA